MWCPMARRPATNIYIKRLLIALGLCVVVLVGPYLVGLAINAVDEELTSEAKKLIEEVPPPPTVPSEYNAFYAVLGFPAQVGQDIHAWGSARVEAYHKAIREDPRAKWRYVDPTTASGAERVDFRGAIKTLCTRDVPSCLAHVSKSERSVAELLKDNATLVSRYRGLYRYRAYENPLLLTLTTPFPSFFHIGTTADLILTDTALKATRGRVDAAFSAVMEDMAFWRRMLPGRQLLIEKMVKASRLSADLRVLSELIGRYGVPKNRDRQLAELLGPLTDRERGMEAVFRNEAILTGAIRDRELLKATPGSEGGALESVGVYLAMPFYQPNAMFNRHAQAWALRLELAKVPASRFVEQLVQYQRRFEEFEKQNEVHWYDWYNPIGKILFAIAGPGHLGRSVACIHDLEGLLRLVALQAQIKQRAIADAKIETFLGTAGAQYHNPYADAPMRWDAAKRSLSFDGLASGEKKLVEVLL